MDKFLSKITSRKFLISLAAFLMALGTGITGLVQGNETLTIAGGVCCVVAGAIYSGCEAYVDGKAVSSSQTTVATTITANTTGAKAKEVTAEVTQAVKEATNG